MKPTTILTVLFLLSALAGLAEARPDQERVKPEVAVKVRTAVEDYVKREAQLKGGFFLRESKNNPVRDLRFDYVHEGVKKAPANQYFVCVDFLDPSKSRLDVDFYLKPTESGDFQVTKIKVHKINGVEKKEE